MFYIRQTATKSRNSNRYLKFSIQKYVKNERSDNECNGNVDMEIEDLPTLASSFQFHPIFLATIMPDHY
jgi:hypothetical protein